MSPKPKAVWSEWSLFGVVLLLVLACSAFHIKQALAGHSIYRDQHLGTAVVWAKEGINLLKPTIIGFNANHTPTPQEFPFWQALTALMFKALGPWFGWGNVVSLISVFSALYPRYQLAVRCGGRRTGIWALVFFVAQPLIFIEAGKAGVDGFSEATQIWYLYFGVLLLEKPGIITGLLAALGATLCVLSKLPFYMAASLALLFLLLLNHRNSLKSWIGLAAVGIFSAALFFAWTHYTDQCIADAKFVYVDLRLRVDHQWNKQMFDWYFGDMHFRMNPANWAKGAWRVLNACFGSFILVSLPLYSLLFLKKNSVVPKVMLAGVILTILVFVHLVLKHTHYYLMLTPVFALLSAVAMVDLEKRIIPEERWQSNLSFCIGVLVLLLSLAQGLVGLRITVELDPFESNMAKVIEQRTRPSDKLLIVLGGWGGNCLMLSHREGLSILTTKFLENPANLKEIKELGYNKLVMLSESPILVATQISNPGGSDYKRATYDDFSSPIVKNWPVLYQTDDIVIRDIP